MNCDFIDGVECMICGIIKLSHDSYFDRMLSLSWVWIIVTRDLIWEDNDIFKLFVYD